MTTRTKAHTSTRHTQPCSCGGACCEDMPCNLECHIRPRFFCGQLLFDEDLTTMVDWTSGKLQLQRFRDGWGVACGLEVRGDPDNPTGVIVGEGYAVSCCGDDIIVCTEEKLDLDMVWHEPNPCTDPEAAAVEYEGEGERRKRADLIGRVGQHGSASGATQDAIAEVQSRLADPGKQDGNDSAGTAPTRWVDVFATYREEDADPRATLRHTDCVEAPQCEAAKTRESYELYWEPGGADPADTAAQAWCRGYKQCLCVLHQFADAFGESGESGSSGESGGDWSVMRRWLLDWIDRHPPHVYCDLRELICSLTDDELADRHLEILVKLVLDCRGAYTRKRCHSCEHATTGVRLARVYLGQLAEDRPPRVRYIDNYPPFRRKISPTTLPAPVGKTNIGSIIGERWGEACRHLADLGISATCKTLALEQGVDGLLEQFETDCDPIVECGDSVTVLVTRFDEDWDTDKIVIGFRTGYSGGAAVNKPDAASPAVSDPPDEHSRTNESARLRELSGVTDVGAERLLGAGLTLETIATDPEAVARVEKALPRGSRAKAAQIVAEAQRRRQDTGGDGPGGA
ncbi:hypothetical protein [Rhodococcus sp. IEGM 1307]|uniref:hypothetical protein n=1 Tax=Rhodococcus sp. IEGM 1307 TaxID=3047091 RepID=UPI0024B83846|nr:hypothetical protein [Rhodococcus sp. IEGM 1307]MDI9978798.1 hypothetical protein [Rhodococcus sp. IEGM 1307]